MIYQTRPKGVETYHDSDRHSVNLLTTQDASSGYLKTRLKRLTRCRRKNTTPSDTGRDTSAEIGEVSANRKEGRF